MFSETFLFYGQWSYVIWYEIHFIIASFIWYLHRRLTKVKQLRHAAFFYASQFCVGKNGLPNMEAALYNHFHKNL